MLPLPTPRVVLWSRLRALQGVDVAVVGGGATGLSVALDAAQRGLSVLLVESHDFAAGTSSRSTKLVHGGVRYLAQGRLGLVREALRERAALLRNAPHLAQPLPFVVPAYRGWERPYYGAGLVAYDLLAGRAGLGATRWLSAAHTLAQLPQVRAEGLRGGIGYWDGQFDDARLAVALARTAAACGALVLNHCEAIGLRHSDGRVSGLVLRCTRTGAEAEVRARCVVNATGVWVDALRALDAQSHASGHTPPPAPLVQPSQGVHLVVDRSFLDGPAALMVPRTADGRVLFAVPWLGKLVLGTTDTPRADLPREPRPLAAEVDFILTEAARYLRRAPTRGDVRSAWVGLRPLVRPQKEEGGDTATGRISREHTVHISASGLITVTGGKWTTARAMAEGVLAQCQRHGLLPASTRRCSATATLPLVGAPPPGAATTPLSAPPGLHLYGSEAAHVAALPGADEWLAPGLSAAMVRFAARHEYALTVEDVLARRSRWLFLDAALAAQAAERVGAILAEETGTDPQVADFVALAQLYQSLPAG